HNLCTTDSCDPALGCVHTAARSCDDGNVCTTDSCDPATGDCTLAPNAAACEDGNPCTAHDTCADGTSHGGPPLASGHGSACPAVQRTLLRVRVAGVGTRQVTGAHLLLQVAKVTNAQSVSGGRIHPITDCGWNERTMTWSTQPAIDGPVLATAGAVAQGRMV